MTFQPWDAQMSSISTSSRGSGERKMDKALWDVIIQTSLGNSVAMTTYGRAPTAHAQGVRINDFRFRSGSVFLLSLCEFVSFTVFRLSTSSLTGV